MKKSALGEVSACSQAKMDQRRRLGSKFISGVYVDSRISTTVLSGVFGTRNRYGGWETFFKKHDKFTFDVTFRGTGNRLTEII
jgi:hypothetical protein